MAFTTGAVIAIAVVAGLVSFGLSTLAVWLYNRKRHRRVLDDRQQWAYLTNGAKGGANNLARLVTTVNHMRTMSDPENNLPRPSTATVRRERLERKRSDRIELERKRSERMKVDGERKETEHVPVMLPPHVLVRDMARDSQRLGWQIEP